MFATHVLHEWAQLPVTTFANYCCMDAYGHTRRVYYVCVGMFFYLVGALSWKKKVNLQIAVGQAIIFIWACRMDFKLARFLIHTLRYGPKGFPYVCMAKPFNSKFATHVYVNGRSFWWRPLPTLQMHAYGPTRCVWKSMPCVRFSTMYLVGALSCYTLKNKQN